jgi:hypothetical protein
MKHGNGIKDRDDRSNGIEILMADAFAKINPTDPWRLAKQVSAKKTKLIRLIPLVIHWPEQMLHGAHAEIDGKQSSFFFLRAAAVPAALNAVSKPSRHFRRLARRTVEDSGWVIPHSSLRLPDGHQRKAQRGTEGAAPPRHGSIARFFTNSERGLN